MKSGLLVIDVQQIYTNPESEMYCKDSRRTVERINQVLARFEERGLPIYLIRHVHKTDGSDLGRMFDYLGEAEEDFNFKTGSPEVEYDGRLRRPTGPQIKEFVKNRYSAFEGTTLEKALRSDSVDTIVLTGFMTNFCCESTARQAHDRDFYVDFLIDATGTPGTENMNEKEIRHAVAETMEAGIARVSTTKTFLKSF